LMQSADVDETVQPAGSGRFIRNPVFWFSVWTVKALVGYGPTAGDDG
jgi:hypothetical protein